MFFIILGSIPFIAYIKFISGNKKIFLNDIQIKTFLKIIISEIANIFSKKPKKIDAESLKYLKKYFKKEVEMLETLNIDTSKWRDY